ncbi:lipoma-preferred partner zyxin isoform 2-T2 [Cochliomyia hominivorax]
MDELEEQLRQLSIINSQLSFTDANKELSIDGNNIDVAKLVNSIEEKTNSYQDNQGSLKNRLIYGRDLSGSKKVGPLVPPKPLKKSPNLPEIPQSSLVKQTCEPLYAQRLQSLEVSNYDSSSEISKQPLLLRKQNPFSLRDDECSLNSPGSLALKSRRKVTLDNPAILEQQLEALEHHKKQLEKRGKLNQNYSNNSKSVALHSNALKLSSSSLFTDDLNPHNFIEKQNVTYANTANKNTPSTSGVTGANAISNIYGNVNASGNNIYSNIVYDKEQQDQACVAELNSSVSQIPQPQKKSVSTTNDDNSIYFTRNGSMNAEDEIPPPPSPVSSSYSELRRATEIGKSVIGYELPNDHKLSGVSNDMRQLYINKPPYTTNDAFNKYNTAIQPKTNQNFSDYYGYGGFSQTSSTYESIYEPINPRPPSQLSTRPQNLMYPTCMQNSNNSSMPECGVILGKSNSSNLSTLSGLSGGSSADSNSPVYPNSSRGSEGGGTLNSYPQNPKESEVESLTDFLVKSMDPQQDLENYGICFKCNEIVVGENSGCTAMDQIYHIACFTCSQCQINLQGKPFYALDCKPYCEFDYLQTLEKCSVCMKPILERILRATGKPYHPQCFTCVVCKKSLDGIPFTVDATNQNYCIEDFHKKFAPRCCVCKEPIMPEPGEEETVRVVALDRSFHFECYKCEDCGLLLSSEAEGRGCYPLDDHVLCKSCNAKRVQMLTNRMTTTEL